MPYLAQRDDSLALMKRRKERLLMLVKPVDKFVNRIITCIEIMSKMSFSIRINLEIQYIKYIAFYNK